MEHVEQVTVEKSERVVTKRSDKVISYKVWYKLNPEYDGTFQVSSMGTEPALHAHVLPSMGGLPRAKQEAQRCKAWFNEEKILLEKQNPATGKVEQTVKTVMHDNVVVWVEKYIDSYPADEEVPWEEERSGKKKKELAAAS